MSEDKIGMLVEKVLRACNNPNVSKVIEELTNGPVVFTEKDGHEVIKKGVKSILAEYFFIREK